MIKKAYFLRFLLGLASLFSLNYSAKALARPPSKPIARKVQSTVEKSRNFSQIISFFEKKYNIPQKLLTAIAKVESEYSPWAINAEGQSRVFSSQSSALHYIKLLKRRGVKNINVGYMQINLASHGNKFKTLEDSLNPYHNIKYAAYLIAQLYQLHGCWERAIGFYHSSSPKHRLTYKNKVLRIWEKITEQPAPALTGKIRKI